VAWSEIPLERLFRTVDIYYNYAFNVYSFFSLIVFNGTEVPFFLFSSDAPQRTAYSKVLSEMAARLKTGSPL
jgi:hypothetical protein